MKNSIAESIKRALQTRHDLETLVTDGSVVVARVTPWTIKWSPGYGKIAPKVIRYLIQEFRHQIEANTEDTLKRISHLEINQNLLNEIIKAEEKRFLGRSKPLVNFLITGDIRCYLNSLKKAGKNFTPVKQLNHAIKGSS